MPRTKKRVINLDEYNLSRLEEAFVRRRLENPTEALNMSAMIVGYKPQTPGSRSNIGGVINRSPKVQMALAAYSEFLEAAIIKTVDDWKDHKKPRQREIAMQSAQFAYDHIHGKATQRVEQTSTVVQIAINLTGDNDSVPEEFLDVDPEE
jgi:hypothetical protein